MFKIFGINITTVKWVHISHPTLFVMLLHYPTR